MSDAAENSNDDHWSRLASELGLESEPRESTGRSFAETPRPEPTEEPAELTNPDESADEPPAPQRGRRRRGTAEREAEVTALTEAEPPAEPDLLDDEPPPERPRRGRKPASEEGENTEENVASTEERGESASSEEAPKRRRRRRSRKRRGGDQSEPVAAESSESTDTEGETADAEATPEPAEDNEPAPEVIADWNVPSWNDLIASLHRPDR
jgi:ribonuclease E